MLSDQKKSSQAWEVNFDGLVGTTHNYAGLAYGNVASMRHEGRRANPKEAALKGLEKMYLLMALGVKQALIPPQERPHLPTLRKIGFEGPPEVVLSRVAADAPHLLAAVCSASSMWAANSATISPSVDSQDGKLHVTPANLITHLHRSIEAEFTSQIFKKIFKNPSRFSIHPFLPPWRGLSDEGAANHLRLCRNHGRPGLEVFVYGRNGTWTGPCTSFPKRQTLEASQAVARLHGLDRNRTLFLCQNPEAVARGVFHNDVICTANERILFFHENSFNEGLKAIDQIHRSFESACEGDIISIPVKDDELSIEEAVATYLFNSQILTLPSGEMTFIAPSECENHPKAYSLLEAVVADPGNPIGSVHFVDLQQSMRNGGGPACLRLRVVLTEDEFEKIHPGVLLNSGLCKKLKGWIVRHYRDRLTPEDLSDPDLIEESYSALDELSQILDLGSIYEFQKNPLSINRES